MCLFFLARDRSVDKRPGDLGAEMYEFLFKSWNDARGFAEQFVQFPEDG